MFRVSEVSSLRRAQGPPFEMNSNGDSFMYFLSFKKYCDPYYGGFKKVEMG